MLVLKNRYAPALSGANCHPRLSHSMQLLKKIFVQWWSSGSLIKRYSQWGQQQAPMIDSITPCSNQEERRRDKVSAHTISVHWWHQSLVVGNTWSNQFETCRSWVRHGQWSYYSNVKLLLQFLSSHIRARVNSSSFSITMHGHTGHLKQSTFLSVTSQNVDWFYKLFQSKLSSEYVIK